MTIFDFQYAKAPYSDATDYQFYTGAEQLVKMLF